jgi:hypothetical protein
MIGLLARDHVSVVEGEVSNMTVIRTRHSSTVCFYVQSEKFCITQSIATPAMDSCTTRIRPDLWVRVSYHYYGKPILRLEARRDSLDRVNGLLE